MQATFAPAQALADHWVTQFNVTFTSIADGSVRRTSVVTPAFPADLQTASFTVSQANLPERTTFNVRCPSPPAHPHPIHIHPLT